MNLEGVVITGPSPAPWHQGTMGPNGCPIIGDANHTMVCMLAHSTKEAEQKTLAIINANLIEFSPNLLAASQKAIEHLREERSRGSGTKINGLLNCLEEAVNGATRGREPETICMDNPITGEPEQVLANSQEATCMNNPTTGDQESKGKTSTNSRKAGWTCVKMRLLSSEFPKYHLTNDNKRLIGTIHTGPDRKQVHLYLYHWGSGVYDRADSLAALSEKYGITERDDDYLEGATAQ